MTTIKEIIYYHCIEPEIESWMLHIFQFGQYIWQNSILCISNNFYTKYALCEFANMLEFSTTRTFQLIRITVKVYYDTSTNTTVPYHTICFSPTNHIFHFHYFGYLMHFRSYSFSFLCISYLYDGENKSFNKETKQINNLRHYIQKCNVEFIFPPNLFFISFFLFVVLFSFIRFFGRKKTS